MTSAMVRRSAVFLVSAALLASLAVAWTTAPAAAKPTCKLQPATIVGTDDSEIIRGTPGRDVIVAGGGHDIVYGLGGDDLICGGPGNDRLYGGPGLDRLFGGLGGDRLNGGVGPDRLFGGAGQDLFNAGAGSDWLYGGAGTDLLVGRSGDDRLFGGAGQDILAGGRGRDHCFQGPATGPHLGCEVVPSVKPRNLAIAWSDLDGDHSYGPGDVLISRLFDTNGDGIPSKGDTVYMGRYPLDFKARTFADWGVDSHRVLAAGWYEPEPISWPHLQYSLSRMAVRTENGDHYWSDLYDGDYGEQMVRGDGVSQFIDGYREADEECSYLPPHSPCDAFTDFIYAESGSPSLPDSEVSRRAKANAVDQPFIDTKVYP